MSETIASTEEITAIDKYLSEMKFANAVALARNGQFSAAEQILSELIRTDGEQAPYLDLQARMLVQQGKLREAESKWHQASNLTSDSGAYQRALNRIANLQKRPAWLSSTLFIVLGILLLLMSWTIIYNYTTVKTSAVGDNLTSPSANDLDQLENQLATLGKKLQQLQVDNTVVKPPNLQIVQTGFKLQQAANEVVIVFDEGVFVKGTVISENAQKILVNLGKQLEPYAGLVYIKIFGITDDLPVSKGQKFQDNWDLGNARALAVHNLLRKETKLLPERILVGSYGKFQPPFPNSSHENRIRNRTVIFKVSYSI